MNQMTQSGAQLVYGALFGRLATIPTTYYMALMSDRPVTFMGGDELTEPPFWDEELDAPTGYRRLPIENIDENWGITELGIAYNRHDLEFPLAEQPWGTIRYWALCDSEEEGIPIYIGTFNSPVEVEEGDTVLFPAASFKVGAEINYEAS